MSYTAIVTREGDDWLGEVLDLEGATTYASTLHGLVRYLREVIVLAEGLDVDAYVDLDLDIRVDDPAVRQAAVMKSRRKEAEQELSEIRDETPDAVRGLLAAGYSVRDAAAMIGITPGRVSQLTNQALVQAGRTTLSGTRGAPS